MNSRVSFFERVGSRGLPRNVIAAVAQNVVAIACQLLIYRLLIAHEGIEVLGIWSLTLGLVGFARLADFSGGAALARFVAVAIKQPGQTSPAEYIDSLLLFTTILYGSIGLAIWYPSYLLVASLVDPSQVTEMPVVIALALLSLVLTATTASQLSAIDGLQRADIRAFIVISGWIAHLTAALMLVPSFGLLGLAVAQLGQQTLNLTMSRAVLFFQVPGVKLIPRRLSRTALRESISYGLRLQLITILLIVFDPLSRVMIGSNGGMSALGIYEIAYRIVGHVRTMVSVAMGPLVPAFATASVGQTKETDSCHLLRQVQAVNLPISGGLLALVVLAGPAFSTFLFGKIEWTFLHLLIAFAATSFFHTLAAPLQAMAQGSGRLLGNILGSLGMAAGAVIAIPLAATVFGQDRAGLGVAVGILVGSLFAIGVNCQLFRIPIRLVAPFDRIIFYLSVLAALSLLMLGTSTWLAE